MLLQGQELSYEEQNLEVLSLRKSQSQSLSLYITLPWLLHFHLHVCLYMFNFEEFLLFLWCNSSSSFFQMSGAFTIFITEIVVFQCVISEKTGLQAHVYSTHCTAVKGIYMLQVNLASGFFVTAFVKVVKVFLIKSNVRSRQLLHLSVPPEGFSFNQVTYQ